VAAFCRAVGEARSSAGAECARIAMPRSGADDTMGQKQKAATAKSLRAQEPSERFKASNRSCSSQEKAMAGDAALAG